MIKIFKEHYPSSKKRFMIYLKLFYPMIIGSTLYALNGFVDNFMVGHIEQGVTALSAVNSWTNIIIGVFVGIGAAGSVINARYYFSGQFEKAQELFKFRIILAVSIASVMAVVALITPESLIKVFLKKGSGTDVGSYDMALANAKDYMRVIVFTWIMIGFSSQMGNSLREIGHGKASMYWGIATIIINISLNSILMYGFDFGVEGAAYASLAARITAIIMGIGYILIKKPEIGFNPLKFFKIRRSVVKDFFSKWYLIVAFSIVTLFITFRNFFYDAGYPSTNSSLGKGVSAMMVLGITGAIMNIFTTTFAASGSMASNVVGKELAKGNSNTAYKYAKELKGFMTSVAICLSILMAIVAAVAPYLTFLSETKYYTVVDGTHKIGDLKFDGLANLHQVRNSLFVICFFYPTWIWFITSYRSASTGKKGFWFAFIDMLISGPVQLLWIAILAYFVVPHSTFMQENFWVTYALFFTTDFLKLIFIENLFYKYPWNQPITKMENKQDIAENNDLANRTPTQNR